MWTARRLAAICSPRGSRCAAAGGERRLSIKAADDLEERMQLVHCVQLARTNPREKPYGNVNVAVAVDDCSVPESVACAVGRFTIVGSVGD